MDFPFRPILVVDLGPKMNLDLGNLFKISPIEKCRSIQNMLSNLANWKFWHLGHLNLFLIFWFRFQYFPILVQWQSLICKPFVLQHTSMAYYNRAYIITYLDNFMIVEGRDGFINRSLRLSFDILDKPKNRFLDRIKI